MPDYLLAQNSEPFSPRNPTVPTCFAIVRNAQVSIVRGLILRPAKSLSMERQPSFAAPYRSFQWNPAAPRPKSNRDLCFFPGMEL
jgi:hypothetical protein